MLSQSRLVLTIHRALGLLETYDAVRHTHPSRSRHGYDQYHGAEAHSRSWMLAAEIHLVLIGGGNWTAPADCPFGSLGFPWPSVLSQS